MHGVEEQEQENTDNIVVNVIKEHLDTELSVKDLAGRTEFVRVILKVNIDPT